MADCWPEGNSGDTILVTYYDDNKTVDFGLSGKAIRIVSESRNETTKSYLRDWTFSKKKNYKNDDCRVN